MKNFREYLKEESSTVYFTFGRMNPPTIGHEKLMDVLAKKSGKDPYKVYLSQSQDSKKNPLSYTDKVKHVRRMFPRHARSIMLDKGVKNVFDIAVKLYNQGFTNIAMVVGSDRTVEFKTLLDKYNGERGRHGFYNFKNIRVISAGERDPDAEGVSGMSASKQRENVKNNNFSSFSQGLPKGMSTRDAKKLFNDIRSGMGLKEQTSFKKHVKLESVSNEREEYIKGNLFEVGDTVVDANLKEGIIKMLGSNYVTVQYPDGSTSRKWLSDVRHTNEEVEEAVNTDSAKIRIRQDRERLKKQHSREKELAKQRHDRIMDRARNAMTKRKNRMSNSYEP